MFMCYHLAKHHDLIVEMAKELSAYQTVDELNLNELEKLPLFNAVIYESLRVYPPAPIPAGRICPPQGIIIDGCFIPGGVRLFNKQH